LSRKEKRNWDGLVSLLHTGHDFGLMCFPFSSHYKSTRADVHYASATFKPQLLPMKTFPYPGFELETFVFQVGNTANWAIEFGFKVQLAKTLSVGNFFHWIKYYEKYHIWYDFCLFDYYLSIFCFCNAHSKKIGIF
jgi:hypothetical protein